MDAAKTATARFATLPRIGWIVALTVLLADEITKTAARLLLPACIVPGSDTCALRRFAGLNLSRVGNAGSPLGFAQGEWIWVVLALLGTTLCVAYARRRDDRVLWIAAGLQLGGAAGNLLDRLVFGHVTDFVVVGRVVLNLADVALLVGAVVGTVALSRLGSSSEGR
jgi:signal peptidase II